MKPLEEAATFLRAVRRKMRFGEFSREPLELLRVEWKRGAVECDWVMRPRDPWDAGLPGRIAETHETMQALRDALTLRRLIFQSFRAVDRAELRMYRPLANDEFELTMTGSVARDDGEFDRVASVVMRARLCGFHFNLDAGVFGSPSRSC